MVEEILLGFNKYEKYEVKNKIQYYRISIP